MKQTKRKGPVPRISTCHPNIPHQGKGLCTKCYLKAWVEAHPGIGKKYWKKNGKPRQIRSYGISVEEYEKLLQKQAGLCAICKTLPTGHNKLCIDHNHITLRVRGLLCTKCNFAISLFLDNPELLDAAKAYLSYDEE